MKKTINIFTLIALTTMMSFCGEAPTTTNNAKSTGDQGNFVPEKPADENSAPIVLYTPTVTAVKYDRKITISISALDSEYFSHYIIDVEKDNNGNPTFLKDTADGTIVLNNQANGKYTFHVIATYLVDNEELYSQKVISNTVTIDSSISVDDSDKKPIDDDNIGTGTGSGGVGVDDDIASEDPTASL